MFILTESISVVGKHLHFEFAIRIVNQFFDGAVDYPQKGLQRVLAAQMRERIGLADISDEKLLVSLATTFSKRFAKSVKIQLRNKGRSHRRVHVCQGAFKSRSVVIECLPKGAVDEPLSAQPVLDRAQQTIALAVVVMIFVSRRIRFVQDFD